MKKHLLYVAAMLCTLSLGVTSACGTGSGNASSDNGSSSEISGTTDSSIEEESSDTASEDSSSECAHSYDNACDADCNVCGDERTPAEHVYDNACDADCNVCDDERTPAEHVYDNACDADCNVCGDERTPAEHVYDNACDADCNVCGDERTPAEHVYDNACDADCNVCGDERTPAEHVYDNACDADCNVCGDERTPAAHVYDDDGDKTCNVCGDEREVGKFSVSFIVDGKTVSSAEAEYGTTVQMPTAPEKDCYEFTGWMNGETAYDFSTPVTGALTLTASWQQTHAYYTVKVMKDGEDISAEYNLAQTKAAIGETVDVTAIAESLTVPAGYYYDSAECVLTGEMTAEGLQLSVNFVKYVSVTFKATADAEGVVVGNLKKGATAKVPASVIPDGYKYAVWTDENGYYDLTKGVEGDITLTASEWYKGIATAEEFMAMEADENYVLENDIDFANAGVFVGKYVVATFNGILEGNGYALKNITLEASSPNAWTAIFGSLGGTVRHIGIENIRLEAWGNKMVGCSALLAQTMTGTLSNAYITGAIEGAAVANMGFTDYSNWGFKTGALVASADGAKFDCVAVNVTMDTEENGITALVGAGAYTFGNLFVVKNANVSGNIGGNGTRAEDNAFAGVDTLETMTGTMDEIFGNPYYAKNNHGVWVWDTEDGAGIPALKKESYINLSMMEFERTNYEVKVYKKVDGEYVDVSADYADVIGDCEVILGKYVDITEKIMAIPVPNGFKFNAETSKLAGRVWENGLTLEVYFDAGAFETDTTYTTEDGVVYTKISTLDQLRAISGTNGNYILVNDIDAGNATYANTTFLGDFAGVLDGNGYSIKNVQIQAANQYWGSGLFGTLSGTVRNIGFENITMLGGTSNYLGKSGFIAQNLTGKAINIYLTGTVSGVVYSSGTADNRYGIVAHDATGGTVYNVRAHIDGMVAGSSALTAAMAPTHWGNFYASYTGAVSAWYGTKVARDLGEQCLESSKEGGNNSAISQGFGNPSNATLEADVAPYISNDYWNMETAELKENIYGLNVATNAN